MNTIFILHHEYERALVIDEVKLIGIYDSRELAETALIEMKDKAGFKDHPDGFSISEYKIDEDNWSEGFVTEYYKY